MCMLDVYGVEQLDGLLWSGAGVVYRRESRDEGAASNEQRATDMLSQ